MFSMEILDAPCSCHVSVCELPLFHFSVLPLNKSNEIIFEHMLQHFFDDE